jgi:CubicO group peptidase (beta-lactamase class C family)
MRKSGLAILLAMSFAGAACSGALDRTDAVGSVSSPGLAPTGQPTGTPTVLPPPPIFQWAPTPDVERRLRILGGLPGVESHLKSQATGYFSNKGPTMSFGLVLDDGLFYSRGFGTLQNGLEPTADTVYRTGSFNKVITGAAFLRFLETHPSVHLDDPVAMYFPPIGNVVYPPSCAAPGSCAQITIRHLLSHASGLPNYGQYAPNVNALSPTENEFIGMLNGTPLAFPPGTSEAYSGVGETVAGILLEWMSGMSYRDWMLKNFLAPMGMTRTVFDPTSLPAGSIADRWYQASSPPGTGQNVTFTKGTGAPLDIGILAPAGQLFTTVRDMGKLAVMELSSQAPAQVPDTFLLKRADLQMSQSPQLPGLGTFGINWILANDASYGPWVWHNGALDGYESDTHLYPAQRIGGTVLLATSPDGAKNVNNPLAAVKWNAVEDAVRASLTADTVDWHGAPLPNAVDRMMVMLNSPPNGQWASNFGPLFLYFNTTSPATAEGDIETLMKATRAGWGSCRTFTVEKVYDATSADVTFVCANKNVSMTIWATAAAPYPIYNFRVN